MKKNEIIQFLNNKYNFNIFDCDFTIKELKTFLNFDKKENYIIKKLNYDNRHLLNNKENIRFNYGYIAVKKNGKIEK